MCMCMGRSFVFSLTNPTGQADVSCLKPGSVMVSGLLEYLWANWDDHMDVRLTLLLCIY